MPQNPTKTPKSSTPENMNEYYLCSHILEKEFKKSLFFKENLFASKGGGLSNVYVVFRGVIKLSTFIYMGGGGVKKGRNLVYVEKV